MASQITAGSKPAHVETPASRKNKREEKSTELTKKAMTINTLEEKNKILEAKIVEKDERIDQLMAEIAEKAAIIAEKEKACLKLAGKDEKISHLRQEIARQAALIKESGTSTDFFESRIESKAEDIFKPTTSEMKNKLIELEPLFKESTSLLKEVDLLRSGLQRLCEIKTICATTLESELKVKTIEFHRLAKHFLELNPKLKKEEKELHVMIANATHQAIPVKALNAMSAYNSISLENMKDNEKTFMRELENIIEKKGIFSSDMSHFSRRFGDIAGHLNSLNYNLGGKKNTNGYLSLLPLVGGSNIYVSPESASYTGKEGLEEIKKA